MNATHRIDRPFKTAGGDPVLPAGLPGACASIAGAAATLDSPVGHIQLQTLLRLARLCSKHVRASRRTGTQLTSVTSVLPVASPCTSA